MPAEISLKAAPDHHITSTMLGRWRQALLQHLVTCSVSHKCSSVWSKHLNLDLSVHNTFFKSSSVQCLCSFAHLNLFLLLASLRYDFFFATLPRRPASWSRLFTVDFETGVLRVPFNEAASWGHVRHPFLKLETLMYLSSCLVVHQDLPLLFLFWLERKPICAVLWRE